MFGVRKKTKPSRVRAAASSSDEDGDGARQRFEQHKRRKKRKDKKKSGPMLSFDPEEGGDDGAMEAQKKSKKRKKHKSRRGGGLGYGGLVDASDGSASDVDKMGRGGEAGGSYYGADALKKLKSEQKRSTLPKDDTAKEEPDTKAESKGADEGGDEAEEEYISLSGAKSKHAADPMVLTGDEAMAFAQREEEEGSAEFDHGLKSPPTIPTAEGIVTEKGVAGKVADMDINAEAMDVDAPSEEVEEGNRRWEDTMARRAGVLPPDASKGTAKSGRPRQPQGGGSSLTQIQSSLQPTIDNLGNIYSDLETSISRHASTVAATQDELTKHQKTLQKHGQALEYYQGLREDLATWMGALRELNGMVERAEAAKRRLEAEVSWRQMERFWEWSNDCAEVLEKEGLIVKTLGGGSADSAGESQMPAQVDEFGRDMSSMASMARVRRHNQRRKRCLERLRESDKSKDDLASMQQVVECTNEDNIGAEEVEEWRKREEALSKAVAIVPNLVTEDYLSIPNLCSLFSGWQKMYSEDYANCYAEMSLVQMVSVLVRLEMCERWGMLQLNGESAEDVWMDIKELQWFRGLKESIVQRGDNGGEADSTSRKNETEPHKSILVQVIQKQVLGRLLMMLSIGDDSRSGGERHMIYNPFSVAQTECLCSCLKSILGCLSTRDNGSKLCEEAAEKVLDSLLSLIKHCVNKMAVPIVDASKIALRGNEFAPRDGPRGFDGEAADAIVYATIVQAKLLCVMVQNILGHWILPVLTALREIAANGTGSDNEYAGFPKKIVDSILASLTTAGLMDQDEWMLLAAPLRAAANQW
ncbi:hypothetical protein ACHAXT_004683 [Thalassiosira profunda]